MHSSSNSPSRDRHGRGIRGPLLPQAVPRYKSRHQLFDAAVLEAYAPILARFGEELEQLDITVDTIPRMRLSGDPALLTNEIAADGRVPLGRVIAAGVDPYGEPTRARIVLFRMPIEQRVTNPQERIELLQGILVDLVAAYLNLSPEDIYPTSD